MRGKKEETKRKELTRTFEVSVKSGYFSFIKKKNETSPSFDA